VLSSIIAFGFSARKTVALSINGETRTVSTYAASVPRLLDEQDVHVRTHDLVQSTSGLKLSDHAVVTVRSAYQTTITIDGREVPFWTVATSADQLLAFFNANERKASEVTVNITNIYNKLTGGLVINSKGPVTVIADGKTSVAPDGSLPAASILDSKGIVIGREDRVSVEKHGGETILRVRRVTHGEQTRMISVPFDTQTIVDPALKPGETKIRQNGANGERRDIYNVTYVDGVEESRTLVSRTTTKIALDRIVAVGPKQASGTGQADAGEQGNSNNGSTDDGGSGATGGTGGSGSDSNDSHGNDSNASSSPNGQPTTSAPQPTSTPSQTPSHNPSPSTKPIQPKPTPTTTPTPQPTTPAPSPTPTTPEPTSTPTPAPKPEPSPTPTGLWHPTPAQAQLYASGAAAQYGWTGQQWKDLVSLWNRESGWRWYAENTQSISHAYGIPQALPGSKMATFGANWRDDGAIQIDWGLNYIAQRYGDPSSAWAHSNQVGWY
jgi:uncharacterized protein YabE (DUF348 family)